MRARIGNAIDATLGDTSGAHLLRALAFGDQYAMSEGEWAVARATGIPHLIAMSGLHIALFASFGVLLMRLCRKLALRLTLRWPAPLIEAVASLAFAMAYALITGFGLPTRRALVMIAALLVASLARRARAGAWASRWPLSLCWRGIPPACSARGSGCPSSVWDGSRSAWAAQTNAVACCAKLSPCKASRVLDYCRLESGFRSEFSGQTVCESRRRAMDLLSGSAVDRGGVAARAGFSRARHTAVANFRLGDARTVVAVANNGGVAGRAVVFPGTVRMGAVALAMLGALWLLMPRGIPTRELDAFLFLRLLWPARASLADGEFMAYMLDVGQGLSIVVRTRDHTLVYDAGEKFPSGFDFGEATVVPALHVLGIERIDRLIVSHGDNDRASGAAAMVAAWPGIAVKSGEPERLRIPAAQCLAGESRNWNGVAIRIVHPREPLSSIGNDRCCVLAVRSGKGELVLDGDITRAVEAEVAAALAQVASQLVLQVPHHGSRTSSCAEFIAALHPELGPISAGYLDRFHHPNPGVVTRYFDADVDLLDAAQIGFMKIRFAADAAPRVIEQGRVDRHAHWRED